LYTGARRLLRVKLRLPRAPRLRQGASIQKTPIPDEAYLPVTFINGMASQLVMKVPKNMKRLCKTCKTHTEHKVAQNKKKTASSLKKGSKYRARLRGRARGVGNLGRYSKPAVTKFKRTGSKSTKKTDLRYTCATCKKMSQQASGIRAKRVEFI
jgi:large subunit ribosomal protein L44e